MKFNVSEREGRVRPDGMAKVTGDLKYLTDLAFPNMLHGKILRSSYPHANIVSIKTERAEQLPGVAVVITHKDVPGMNRFGIIFPDQPVFCEDKVRYVGDAIAAVAAESEAIAYEALALIEVVYEELPVIDDPKKALAKDAPKLHLSGNILHRATFKNGDVSKAFDDCFTVVEETYELPRQMHAYLETEGGVIVPKEDGSITVYAGTQHGFKDRFQLARILAKPEHEIRIISSPMGGSFGGKDELNIQPYGAILALVTGRPVKVHHTRKESVWAGLKRHPMRITMKTGASKTGKIVAHEVQIIADTGAYATLGPAVLDFAVEHASGPYIIPNIDIEGLSVFTNNGVSGEFRGFGGNQITFALEGQINRLAEALGIDPIELRRKNIRKATDKGPLGQRIAPSNGALEVLESINTLCMKQKEKQKQEPCSKWKRKGTGMALAMHGGGLGFGRLDSTGGRLALNHEGKIEIAFGFEECGQGLLAVIENIVIKEIGCSQNDLKIVIGDTALVPVSGSSTASRGTSMVWQSVQRMKEPFTQKICKRVSQLLSIPENELILGENGLWRVNGKHPCMTYKQLAQEMKDGSPLVVYTNFHFPTTPDAVIGGHYLYTFGGVKVEVEVDLLTGKVKVTDLDHVIAAGPVISPNGYRGQIEGGGVMSLGYTLMEEAKMEGGRYVTENFDTYLIPSIADIPFHTNVQAIEALYKDDSHGPRGVGEIGTIAITPAIVNAIHDATGHWVRHLPVSSEEILEAVEVRRMLEWT
ncbi:xanthine dehydrogenase subunit D [Domibacillus aminovorans]|uniref:Xanthine dehydrogenase subunit D n=1 Tax=Domibacillus aminovorans TaxID=29332 RepID=A0A177KK11_9BACI|nr:xanthine dehydrogenase subunit D [Domibacillus aminovorans]OAH53235.1 xanthine dehydrogenase subunit D [Domibacillus aminovorans]